MNRTFDFYEYAGIIVPGSVLLMAVAWLFPETHAVFSKEGVTLGELGLFIILAYAMGQLVQAIGNYLELLWWKAWGGLPSGRVLCDGKYVSANQHTRIVDALRRVLGTGDPCKLPQQDRLAIVREVYSEIAGAGRSARIDTFSGSYGLMRGLAAAFLVSFPLALVAGKSATVLGTLVILFLLAIHRMHRYGGHYATELFTQFLALSSPVSAFKSSGAEATRRVETSS
jgi:hypothetical protein